MPFRNKGMMRPEEAGAAGQDRAMAGLQMIQSVKKRHGKGLLILLVLLAIVALIYLF